MTLLQRTARGAATEPGQIRKRGLGVAAVSYDSVAVLKNFAQRKGITFPLLSDTDSKVIRSYGLLNERWRRTRRSSASRIPEPSFWIRAGVVTQKYFEADFRQRYTASEILVRQYGSAAGATAAR